MATVRDTTIQDVARSHEHAGMLKDARSLSNDRSDPLPYQGYTDWPKGQSTAATTAARLLAIPVEWHNLFNTKNGRATVCTTDRVNSSVSLVKVLYPIGCEERVADIAFRICGLGKYLGKRDANALLRDSELYGQTVTEDAQNLIHFWAKDKPLAKSLSEDREKVSDAQMKSMAEATVASSNYSVPQWSWRCAEE